MALLKVDEYDLHVEGDLHGLPVTDAVEIAHKKVREAWENGYRTITLIHGSPLIQHHFHARAQGRGGIKWELRGCLHRGEWKETVFHCRSKKHCIADGHMTLTLRLNPKPRQPPVWEPLPEACYGCLASPQEG
jgi:hypothetical protein